MIKAAHSPVLVFHAFRFVGQVALILKGDTEACGDTMTRSDLQQGCGGAGAMVKMPL